MFGAGNGGGQSAESIVSQLACYAAEDRARIVQDVSNLLFAVQSLTPSRATLTRNDGSQHTLLKLTGTIPITFGGQAYNTPVELWVTAGYPRARPQLYVTPTRDMAIQPNHKNVDSEGLVYLPYLDHWQPYRYNLAELVASCCEVFSASPPLFAKGTPASSNHTSARSMLAEAQRQQQQYQQQQNQHLHSFGGPPPPPPRPPLPPAYGQTGQGFQAGPPPAYPLASCVLPGVSSGLIGTPQHSHQHQHHQQQPPQPLEQSTQRSTPPQQTEEERKSALIAALQVKLQHEHERFNQKIRQETETELQVQERLTQSQRTIETGMQQLQQQLDQLTALQNDLEERKMALVKWVQRGEAKQPNQDTMTDDDGGGDDGIQELGAKLSADDVVQPTDTWSKQVFTCVAEAAAVEDTLYQLDKALVREVIDLKSFLKEVRKLARKQFMRKALALKVMEAQEQARAR